MTLKELKMLHEQEWQQYYIDKQKSYNNVWKRYLSIGQKYRWKLDRVPPEERAVAETLFKDLMADWGQNGSIAVALREKQAQEIDNLTDEGH